MTGGVDILKLKEEKAEADGDGEGREGVMGKPGKDGGGRKPGTPDGGLGGRELGREEPEERWKKVKREKKGLALSARERRS